MTPMNPSPSRRDWLKNAIGLAPLALGASLLAPPVRHAAGLSLTPTSPLNALNKASGWLNGPPVEPGDLRGKVVLLVVWTYSCVNSLRVLPYLRAWQERYGGRGLAVIGVHSPEFGFEKDAGNVSRALRELDVGFPVALDSRWRVWEALDNNAWPAFYFIGADGRVRGRAIGEGGYDRSERLIQALLSDVDGRPAPDQMTPVVGLGPEAAPDFANLRTPETYLGYDKAPAFPGGIHQDERRLYRTAPPMRVGGWSLTGLWTVGAESALSAAPGASIAYRFHARDLHMVLAPAADGRPARYRIRIDGEPPGEDHGVDADAAGLGVVTSPRMYQFVRQRRPITDRTFEIEFLDAGARAFVFTFG